MNFNGVKVALFFKEELVMQLRDNKPGLRFANMWDFPGGGREGNETPVECAIREIEEEFGITLKSESFIWQKEYPAMHDPFQKAFFLVSTVTETNVENIQFGTEGQRWELMKQSDFFNSDEVVPDLKGRLKDYLDQREI